MEGVIARDPSAAESAAYGLIILGGGIYGATLALEAARRGLRPLLLERDDFGGATSWNSLRIVHGGFRYLQTLDLPRFRESVGERKWFLERFPDLVRPLACLMPLYNEGLRRPAVLRGALAVNDFLSRRRNDGVRPDRHLPNGRVLGAAETNALLPSVNRDGLRGGALWHDAEMPDSQRLVIEILLWACRHGAQCLNYAETSELLATGGRVAGVRAVDRVSETTREYRAPVVVNCAGPWCRRLARTFDRDIPPLYRPSLAFNVVLDREPPSKVALALAPDYPGARTYFLYPWKGRLFAGTYHAPWQEEMEGQGPGEKLIQALLDDLNRCVPPLEVRPGDVLRVVWGRLPVTQDGSISLATREMIYDHGGHGGPEGLFSVSGVKFTTARLVAEKTLRVLQRRGSLAAPRPALIERPTPRAIPDRLELARMLETNPGQARDVAARLVESEAVVHLDDLLLRRTDWGIFPGEGIGERVGGLFGWTRSRRLSPPR